MSSDEVRAVPVEAAIRGGITEGGEYALITFAPAEGAQSLTLAVRRADLSRLQQMALVLTGPQPPLVPGQPIEVEVLNVASWTYTLDAHGAPIMTFDPESGGRIALRLDPAARAGFQAAVTRHAASTTGLSDGRH